MINCPPIHQTLNLSEHPFGWICPGCRKIYSPKTSECHQCNYLIPGAGVYGGSQGGTSGSSTDDMAYLKRSAGTLAPEFEEQS